MFFSSGTVPRFTPWAFMTMALSRACRKISVSDTDLGDSEVNNDMGEIDIDDCAFGDLAITAAMGGVTIGAAHTLEDYDMELVADLGSVHVNNRSESTHFRQSGDAGKLSVNTSVGSVRLSY